MKLNLGITAKKGGSAAVIGALALWAAKLAAPFIPGPIPPEVVAGALVGIVQAARNWLKHRG